MRPPLSPTPPNDLGRDALLGGVAAPPPPLSSCTVAGPPRGVMEATVDADENVPRFTEKPLRARPLAVGVVAVRLSLTTTALVSAPPPPPRLLIRLLL